MSQKRNVLILLTLPLAGESPTCMYPSRGYVYTPRNTRDQSTTRSLQRKLSFDQNPFRPISSSSSHTAQVNAFIFFLHKTACKHEFRRKHFLISQTKPIFRLFIKFGLQRAKTDEKKSDSSTASATRSNPSCWRTINRRFVGTATQEAERQA